MSIKTVVAVLAALALAACSTTAEERRALDQQRCAGYGFSPNSEAFANCLLTIDLDRRADQRARLDRLQARSPMFVYVRERRQGD